MKKTIALITMLAMLLCLNMPLAVCATSPGEDAHSETMSVEADGVSVEEKQAEVEQADGAFVPEIEEKEAPEVVIEESPDEEGELVVDEIVDETEETASVSTTLIVVVAVAAAVAVAVALVKRRKK